MSHPLPPRLLSLTLGLALLISPASALAPAVSAPAPAALATDRTADYCHAAAQMAHLPLTRAQKDLLWARMDEALLAQLEAGTLTDTQLAYFTLPNYRQDLAARYAALAARKPEASPVQIVTAVNMDQDRDFYEAPQPVADPNSLTVLVNKYHSLPADFVPQLEVLGSGYGKGSLRPEAARHFRAMADAARLDGITLYSVSAYRSYTTQRYTYNSYLAQYSQVVVDDFSARPGHSEHQTGLALDINVARTSAHFERTAEYAWLQEHCAEYGFMLRYPKGKESLTGYRFEPWHYRYVGTEIAGVCMEQGLTYEEYTAQLPAEEFSPFSVLSYRGAPLRLEYGTLILAEEPYLAASALAQALGLSAQWKGADLFLTLPGDHTLTLSPGLYVGSDGISRRLSAPVLALENDLYLPLADAAALFNLELT